MSVMFAVVRLRQQMSLWAMRLVPRAKFFMPLGVLVPQFKRRYSVEDYEDFQIKSQNFGNGIYGSVVPSNAEDLRYVALR
jgi:hypothetical protein